jgi:hypothetical protein
MKRRTFAGWHIHSSMQNLKKEERHTRDWFYRRGWFWFRNYNPDHKEPTSHKIRNITFSWSLLIPDRHPGIGLTVHGAGADDDLSFHLGCGLFSLWLSLEGVFSRAFKYRKVGKHYVDDNEVSLRFFHQGVWWMFWMSPNESSSKDPKWRRGSWYPLDTIFGRKNYSSQAIRTSNIVIPMPEGQYAATVELTEDTWQRPRAWWTSHRLQRAHIDCERGIPHPGKGENSYDCEDDATYGLTTEAANEAEAIGKMVASVMRSRQKYGGLDWQPKQISPDVG